MITAFEKQIAVREAEDFAKTMTSHVLSPVVFKLLYNHINPTLKLGNMISDKVLNTPDELQKAVANMIQTLARTEVEESLEYSTKELATYFGVSQTTINKWVAAGRFNIDRPEPRKHIQIPETAKWKAKNGKLFTVKEMVDSYKEQYPEFDADQELAEIKFEIEYLEKKYQGTYELTLGVKEPTELSKEQERDAEEWRYFLNRINESN